MLVVKLELWPWGNESRARELGRCVIANDGEGSVTTGHYTAEWSQPSDSHFEAPAPAAIRNWPRLERSAWELLAALTGAPKAKS